MTRDASQDQLPAAARGSSGTRVAAASLVSTQAWDAYLSNNPGGAFYHLSGWRSILHDRMGHNSFDLVALNDDQVTGVLPLALVSSRVFGRMLVSVPFMNYGGICADNPSVASLLLDTAVQETKNLGADYLEIRSVVPLDTELTVSLRKVSLTLQLDPEPECVWNAFSSKHRNNIRRARKQGLEVTCGGAELLPTFYEVMEQSWRALGTPLYSFGYFAEIVRQFSGLTRIFVCWHGPSPVAVAFNGYFNGTVEGMWAGMRPGYRDLQANYVLYWEMIRDACERGYVRYHLGRSSVDSGSEQFKKRWNAAASQLYWYFYRPDGGPLPALNVENPKYRAAIAAWRHLPLWLLRRVGPRIAPLIP